MFGLPYVVFVIFGVLYLFVRVKAAWKAGKLSWLGGGFGMGVATTVGLLSIVHLLFVVVILLRVGEGLLYALILHPFLEETTILPNVEISTMSMGLPGAVGVLIGYFVRRHFGETSPSKRELFIVPALIIIGLIATFFCGCPDPAAKVNGPVTTANDKGTT